LNILFWYQIINLQTYYSSYTTLYNKVRVLYPDSVTRNFTDSLYNLYAVLNRPLPIEVSKTVLIDMNGNYLTFEDVINKNKGKIIYSDFWATWCAPCLNEIPDLILMQKEYKEKDVAFIFLSLDSKSSIPIWRQKSTELNIEKEQYLVVNDFDAKLSNFINVGAIPVAFVIDKKGNLVSKRAPLPNTSKLKELINNLLLE